ncbi:hypothetical protein H0H87_009363 [Tephrocybe sp. NHM501043]|nr:hypothetical protein H0H87_009363 [Tephrocybe sp. NHM501043]
MLRSLSSLCILALGVVRFAGAVTIGPIANISIVNKEIAPDGFSRPSVLADGTFPGPLIAGNKGDRFQLNVIDSLTDSRMLRATTIHWHGIFQNGTNWADGPAMVTQCPIVPNDSFLYDFNVHDQAGTFWYHSHYSTQYCDGLRGAFVLYDPQDPYLNQYDVDNGGLVVLFVQIPELTTQIKESTVITLADWYHQVAPENPAKPLSTLINGLGRAVNGTATPLAVVNVEAGKRYRFRLVGLSCDAPFNFTIHNHNMTIIEADGEYTTPLIVDSLNIFAGQRYSVIVNANQKVDNYWIRADPFPTRGFAGFDGGRNSAILRYLNAPIREPNTTYTVTRPLIEEQLHSLEKPTPPGNPYPGGADVNIPIRHMYHPENDSYTVNGYPYSSPSVPVLLQILNGTYEAEDLMPKGSVYKLRPNASIELTMYGTGFSSGGPHPFHLHGHAFYVIKTSDSPNYNWKNPVKRDTVNTGLDGEFAVIRFYTDNSGPWFLHCHIDWHIDMGLAVVFAEDPEGTAAHNRPIPGT